MNEPSYLKNSNKKTIQFVSYFYPPIHAIGSIRNYNVVKQSSKIFQRVYVNTTYNNILFQKSVFKNIENINLTSVPTFDFQTVKLLVSKLKRKSNKKVPGASNSKLLQKLNSFPLNLIIGEGGLVYIIFNILILLSRIYKLDYIYSSYSPHSDHFIAYIIKRIKPKIVWIADFRDLPRGERYDSNGKFLSYNSKIIKRADFVTTVSNGFEAKLAGIYDNTHVMRNSITNPDDVQFESNKQYKLLDNLKFNISYTGTLYSEKSDPSILFKVLKSLIEEGIMHEKKLMINYAGKNWNLWNNYINKYNLSNISNTMGLIDLDASLSLQHESNINLILTWSSKESKGVIPGKLYEYISSRRPIISIINGEYDDEYDLLFNKLNHCIVVNTDNKDTEDLLRNYLIQIYSNYIKNKDTRIEEDAINTFTWDTVYKKAFSKIID